MFDIGWSELALIAVVALIAIGPKELPGVLRTVGQWVGKMRRMAAEFQGQFQEAMREAEMADLKQSFDEVRQAASGRSKGSLITSLQKDVTNALRIDDPEKPMDTQAAPTTEAAAAPVTEPVTPTTPAQPTPDTFLEAADHGPVGEPAAGTKAAETPHAAATDSPASTESDVLKDARAS
jgi:sec-independent protein translocase protein TatB